MNVKLIVYTVLVGAIGHNSYGMIRSFRSGQVKPLIGNYADPYKFGSRRISPSISPDFIPENIQRALRGKEIARQDVFFILYDLSGLKSPYNMVMHPALKAWTGKNLVKKNVAMGFYNVQGIERSGGNQPVPFNSLKNISVNRHNGKGLAFSPNNARFKKGGEGLGAGWFVALSPDGKSASISYMVLIYNKNLWDWIEGSRTSRSVDIESYFGALERTYEMLGSTDQKILRTVLENMRRFFIPGYAEPSRREPRREPRRPRLTEERQRKIELGRERRRLRALELGRERERERRLRERELESRPIVQEEDILLASLLELHDALRNLLNELKRPAPY